MNYSRAAITPTPQTSLDGPNDSLFRISGAILVVEKRKKTFNTFKFNVNILDGMERIENTKLHISNVWFYIF